MVLEVQLNDIPIKMELDTGAPVSIISSKTYIHIKKPPMEHTYIQLKTYTGELIKITGTTKVKVRYNEVVVCDLQVLVVSGDGPNLMEGIGFPSSRLL